MQGLQNPALLNGLSKNLIERTRYERGTVRTQEDQATVAVEFENQVRRIPDQRAVTDFRIAQLGGLLAELASKLAKLCDEFRSVLSCIFAQRATSRRKANQSAPT